MRPIATGLDPRRCKPQGTSVTAIPYTEVVRAGLRHGLRTPVAGPSRFQPDDNELRTDQIQDKSHMKIQIILF